MQNSWKSLNFIVDLVFNIRQLAAVSDAFLTLEKEDVLLFNETALFFLDPEDLRSHDCRFMTVQSIEKDKDIQFQKPLNVLISS